MKTYRRQAQRLRNAVKIAGGYLSDEQAVEVPSLFMLWADKTQYSVNDRVRYGEYLYKCLTLHTSNVAANWIPGAAPTLWARVDDPTIEWPEWRQPSGAHDAYAVGTKVTYNGKYWINTHPANTYAPGVYGWTQAA